MSKTKGTTLVGAVRFLRHNRERAQELLPPELLHYLEERIQESRWYPEADLLGLLKALLQLIPGPREEALEQMGVHTAREHMTGIYSHLRNERSAAPSSSQAFALWASQHDSGRLSVEQVGPGETRMFVHDFGLPSEIMCGIFGGYFKELIRLQGASEVVGTKEECRLRGDDHCSWRVTFTTPESTS